MALSTYTELKTAIANWLGRDDTDLLIPDFIALCEAGLNNDTGCRVRKMTTEATYISLNGLVPFYDDYLALRSIRNTDGNPLELVSPSIFAQRQAMGCIGCPRWYTELAGEIHIFPAPDYVSLDIVYYKRLPALSDINTTNWLLQNYPNIYLYGSLLEAASEAVSAEKILLWQARYDAAALKLHTSDKADRWSGSPVTISMPCDVVSCFTNEADYVPPGVSPTPPEFVLLMDDQFSTIDIAYDYNITSHFEGAVSSYAIHDAPTWLTMDAGTGIMSGTPTAEAIVTGLTVSATNDYGTTISNTFQMHTFAAVVGLPRFDMATAPRLVDLHCNVNIPFLYDMSVHFLTGATVQAYQLDNAPSWMLINSDGIVSGTPLAIEADVVMSVTAINSNGSDTTSTFTAMTKDEVATSAEWRMYVDENTFSNIGSLEFVIVSALKMMDTHGGNTITQGGVASVFEGTGAENAFDGNDVTKLQTPTKLSSPINGWVQYTFASPVSIVEFMLYTETGYYTGKPVDFAFQYKDGSGDWITTFNMNDGPTGQVQSYDYYNVIKEP